MSTDTQLNSLETATEVLERTNGIKEQITKFIRQEAVDSNEVATKNGQVTAESTQVITFAGSISTKAGQMDDIMLTGEVDTQETQLHSLTDYTQYSHFSLSQTEDNRFAILDKYLTSFCKTNHKTNAGLDAMETDRATDSNHTHAYRDSTQHYLDLDLEIGKIKASKDAALASSSERTINVKDPMQNTQQGSAKESQVNTQEKETTKQKELDIPSDDTDSENEALHSQSETTIPFKIIEELNRVKSTLNRWNERKLTADSISTDSGYRTDSQAKSCRSGEFSKPK